MRPYLLEDRGGGRVRVQWGEEEVACSYKLVGSGIGPCRSGRWGGVREHQAFHVRGGAIQGRAFRDATLTVGPRRSGASGDEGDHLPGVCSGVGDTPSGCLSRPPFHTFWCAAWCHTPGAGRCFREGGLFFGDVRPPRCKPYFRGGVRGEAD